MRLKEKHLLTKFAATLKKFSAQGAKKVEYGMSKHTPYSRGRTYVMITNVSKENNLGPGDTIRCIWGLKGPVFIL